MTGDTINPILRVYTLPVSIHARRVTGDKNEETKEEKSDVSIHARRVTGDNRSNRSCLTAVGFNSRPSCDGRLLWRSVYPKAKRVSIHARRVTGDKRIEANPQNDAVSIHARRVTGDIKTSMVRSSA